MPRPQYVKHCSLPLRVYNCIGILSVHAVVDIAPAEASLGTGDVAMGNLILNNAYTGQWQSCGKINVIN